MSNTVQSALIDVLVTKIRMVAEEIVSLELVAMDGLVLPEFDAGSHIDLHVGDFVRQYSICSSPKNTESYRLAIKLEANGRGGSLAVHDIEEGQHIQISTPRNLFPLEPSATHSILIAGGIGITPMLAMASTLRDKGASFELHYCCRTKEHAAFYIELLNSSFADNLYFHFDDGEPEKALDLITALAEPSESKHLYVCGPDGFMAYVTNTAKEELNWSDNNVHLESFGTVDMSQDDDDSFDVVIASTGKSISVAGDKNVVEALAEHGIEIPLSCEQGICGTCLTRILEGTPDHRDMYLTDEEKAANDQFTPCCSRSLTGRLVLDL